MALRRTPHSAQPSFFRRLGERIATFFRLLVSSPLRLLNRLFLWTGALVWGILFLIAGGALYLFLTLPNPAEMSDQQFRDLVAKRVHQQLENPKSYYRWTPISGIHRDLLYAIVYAEDGRFFEHDGLNYDALVAAMAANYQKGTFAYGASTISQQVAKNLFLDQNKNLLRKLSEVILTKRLESRFSKNRILELYLNLAEFGPDIFGVGAAARYYFGKTPDQINAAEGAFLALLLPSPKRYHYSLYLNENMTTAHRKKLRRILQEMRGKDFISQKQYYEYLKYPYFRKLVNR